MTFLDRFWARVDISGDCLVWTGSRTNAGYGTVYTGQGVAHQVTVSAHRLSWEIAHATPVPVGFQVLHRCDNPPCVKPAHLFLGQDAENVRDMWAKGRGVLPMLRGSQLPFAKLDEAAVLRIKARLAAGEQGRVIANAFNVSPSTVSLIRRNRIWKHAEAED